MVNRLDLRVADSRLRAAPNHVRLYGERDGAELLLGEWASDLWFSGPYGAVSLFAANTTAFAAYRVEFPAAPGKDGVQLTALALYQALELECAAADGWPGAEVGRTLYWECGKAAGFVARQCLRQGATAVWGSEDRSGCVRVTPPIGRVYLDVVLAVWNCTLAEWEEVVGAAVHRVLVRELRAKEEDVRLPSREERTMQDVFLVRSLVRVEGEKGEKAALVEALRKAATEVSTRVREELGEAGEGMAFAFEGEALVRQCYTVLWIVLGSIAGLCIMAFCAVIVYRRWRQNHIVQFSKRTL